MRSKQEALAGRDVNEVHDVGDVITAAVAGIKEGQPKKTKFKQMYK